MAQRTGKNGGGSVAATPQAGETSPKAALEKALLVKAQEEQASLMAQKQAEADALAQQAARLPTVDGATLAEAAQPATPDVPDAKKGGKNSKNGETTIKRADGVPNVHTSLAYWQPVRKVIDRYTAQKFPDMGALIAARLALAELAYTGLGEKLPDNWQAAGVLGPGGGREATNKPMQGKIDTWAQAWQDTDQTDKGEVAYWVKTVTKGMVSPAITPADREYLDAHMAALLSAARAILTATEPAPAPAA